MPWRGPEQDGEVPSLGGLVIDFLESAAVIPDGEFAGQPFILSDVQAKFTMNFYRLKPEAVADLTKPSQAFHFSRGGQLVASQKAGKGPYSAAIIIAEAYGPVLFDGWDANGEPVGRPWSTPWIQVTAVSEDQTANIWRSLLPMIMLGNLRADIPDTGETRINLPNGGRIEPVTASARSRLGQRITFNAQDEAHSWTKRNGGRLLADNQRRNLAGMGGRFLEPLALDTPVPTPSGWKTVGTLLPGDEVYGSDGKAVEVSDVTPVFLGRPCYTVKFDDGECITATDTHGWTVIRTHRKKKRGTDIVTMTTAELGANLGRCNLSIPLVSVEGEERVLPVDPYYLGLWLGDGKTADAAIACDWKIVDELSEQIRGCLEEHEELVIARERTVGTLRPRRARYPCRWGHDWSEDQMRNGGSSVVCGACQRNEPRLAAPLLTMREKLRSIGVLGHKHIPAEYLMSARRQRLSLLQGLIDSDGHLDKDGHVSFTNINEQLANQVCELAISLGYKARIHRYNYPYLPNPYFMVGFTPDISEPVARLRAKVSRHKKRGDWASKKFIRSVTPTETVPTRCVGVAAKDHLFLVGTHGTLTHNTGNAWDPAEHSVAQDTWEAKGTEVYKMMLESGPGSIRNKRERMRMLKKLYASSWWVDPERISAEIDDLLERGEVAQAERFFLNRIVPGEDRAFDARRWNELARPDIHIADGALITIGVDGARYFDAIAVVATDVATGHQWPLGIWERPPEAPEDYEHPFDEVDGVVIEAFKRWNVWRLYADPGSQYANISPLVDKWQGRWGDKRVIAWMMSMPKKTAYMLRSYVSAMMTGDLTHDGNPQFAAHIENARRKQITQYDEDGVQMWVIQKETPRSPLKIDAAAAGGLSWEARSDAIASGKGRGSVYDARLREKQGLAASTGRSTYDRRLAQRKQENSGV